MKPSSKSYLLAGLAGTAVSGAIIQIKVNACPAVHVFGARETTLPQGFGTAQVLIDLIQKTFPGPRPSKLYIQLRAVTIKQLVDFQSQCPDSIVIMYGYSQGARIMDNAFCRGPDGSNLNNTASLVSRLAFTNVAVIILIRDPRHVAGRPYNVDNATAPGFAARPVGFQCKAFQDRIQSYCDAAGPFCSNGTSTNVHEKYGKEYGHAALQFIVSKITL